MNPIRRRVVCLALATACGGHSEYGDRKSVDVDAGAGAFAAGAFAIDDDPPQGGGEGSNEMGGAPSQPEPELAGAQDQAGQPGYIPHIGSGTRTCESADYCFGLNCYAPLSFAPTVCVAPCESNFDCGVNEVCVHSQKLAPTCYGRCRVPGDCEYHFDCLDFTGQGQLVCFPSGWAKRRDDLE